MLKNLMKRIAGVLFGDYGIYRVFALDLQSALSDPRDELIREGFSLAGVTADDVARARAQVIRETAQYGGPGSMGFAILRGGEIVALEWYWFGKERSASAFWPLDDHEAESAFIVTVPEMRGRRLAQRVKQYSAVEMRRLGFRRAYGKIWHTHYASIGANRKSGFREIALVIDLYPFGGKRRLRFVRRRPKGA